jgi:hypothetical protein
MSSEPYNDAGRGLQRHLDRAEVMEAVVVQLRKDLSTGDALAVPVADEDGFEALRVAVVPRLMELQARGNLQAAMYRVDIPEAHLKRTMSAGGLHALAGECVLRALQKVLTRLRYAGRW